MKIRDSIWDIVEAIKETRKGNYASDSVVQERISTCEMCGNFTIVPVIKTRHCNECMCDIDLKTMFKKMECPMGKWHGEE
jgi:hypothetical protein